MERAVSRPTGRCSRIEAGPVAPTAGLPPMPARRPPSSSQLIGFIANPVIPAPRQARRVPSSTLAERAMIGTFPAGGGSALICRVASMPSSRGICTSMRITSNRREVGGLDRGQAILDQCHAVAMAGQHLVDDVAIDGDILGQQDAQRFERAGPGRRRRPTWRWTRRRAASGRTRTDCPCPACSRRRSRRPWPRSAACRWRGRGRSRHNGAWSRSRPG